MSSIRILRILALAALLAPGVAAAAETRAFVVTSDFQNGGVSAIDLSTRAVTRDVATVYSDARIRWFGGLIYVINRLSQDNIQVIDPAQNYATIHQYSVGNGSNPQDILVVSPTKAYVTRLGSPRLLIVNPSSGDSLGAISLAAFADGDGIPEMDRMFRLGNRVFVSLGRLAGFQPTDHSDVAVIDLATDMVIDADPVTAGTQAIVLPATNPVTPFVYDAASNRLLIGCAGHYQAADGGVARVDPVGLVSDGLAVTESALGGDVLDVVWRSATRAFSIVSDAGFNTKLVAWDPSTGMVVGPPLFAPGGFSLADVALDDRDELYVCDNDLGAPGVFVFSAATGGLLAGPLDTGLPPFEIAFDGAADLAAVAPLAVHGVRLSAPWPLPSHAGARATLELGAATEVRAAVLDVAGRSVRTLASGPWGAGRRDLVWDGRDEMGARVSAGIYLLDVRAGSERVARRIVVIP